jgi:hypothetical protein
MTETMLYLSTSKQALKRVLETTASPDSLAKPVAIRLGDSLAKRVTTANTGSLVIYPRRMSRQAGETLDWLAGILTATRNISISRLNQEMVRMRSRPKSWPYSERTRERPTGRCALPGQTRTGAGWPGRYPAGPAERGNRGNGGKLLPTSAIQGKDGP